jgi:hypothetical protein
MKALAALYDVSLDEIDAGGARDPSEMGDGYLRFLAWLDRQPYGDTVDRRVFRNLEALDPHLPEEMYRGIFTHLHGHYGS